MVFNRPIEQVLTYRVPSRLKRIIQPGQRVRVPLGRGDRLAVGYCVRVDASAPGDLDPSRIKDVVEVLDPLPLIDDKMLELTRWMADYYACSWGQALDAVVPAGVKKHAGTRIGTFLVVPAGDPRRLAGRDPQAPAAAQADGRARGPVPERRASDRRRRLPHGQVHDRADPGASKAGAGALRFGGGCRLDCQPRRAGRPTAYDSDASGMPAQQAEPAQAAATADIDRRAGRDARAAGAGDRVGRASRRFWFTVSPAAARPRSTWRRSRKSWRAGGRRSCWCPRSASRRRRSAGSAGDLPGSRCCIAT